MSSEYKTLYLYLTNIDLIYAIEAGKRKLKEIEDRNQPKLNLYSGDLIDRTGKVIYEAIRSKIDENIKSEKTRVRK